MKMESGKPNTQHVRVYTAIGMQTYLNLSHPQQGQPNPDLSRLEGAAQPHDEFGLIRDGGERVVNPEHLVLLVVAIETIDLRETGEGRKG